MAKNEVYRLGQYFPLPVPEGTESGDPIRIGVLNGIAATGRGVEGNYPTHASFDNGGAWLVPVDIVTNPIAPGAAIYITGANVLTNVATGNKLYGAFIEDTNVAVGTQVLCVVKPSPIVA